MVYERGREIPRAGALMEQLLSAYLDLDVRAAEVTFTVDILHACLETRFFNAKLFDRVFERDAARLLVLS